MTGAWFPSHRSLPAGQPHPGGGTSESLRAEFDLEGFGLGITVATALIRMINGAAWSGIDFGAAASVAPIYTAEVAPSRHRRRLVGLFHVNVAFGILAASISHLIILQIAPEPKAWRRVLGVEVVTAHPFHLFMFAGPEIARWLMAARRPDEA